jgi:hypothetical protein
MVRFDDPRVRTLGELMTTVARAFGGEASAVASPRLNAIVRRYRANDVIGFHTDRKEYTVCATLCEMIESRSADSDVAVVCSGRDLRRRTAE